MLNGIIIISDGDRTLNTGLWLGGMQRRRLGAAHPPLISRFSEGNFQSFHSQPTVIGNSMMEH